MNAVPAIVTELRELTRKAALIPQDEGQAIGRITVYEKPSDKAERLVACDFGTDLDASIRFADAHAEKIRYCPGLGWLSWDKRRWAICGTGPAIEFSKWSARMWTIKASESSADNRDQRIKSALGFESAAHIKATVDLAKSNAQLVLPVASLDASPWKLNVLNGTLDLRTGTLSPHAIGDFLTKLAPVKFEATATNAFLSRYLDNCERSAPGMTAFLARCFGAALTGDASAETLFLLQGDGGSGKTTLVEAVAAMLGDYAAKLNFDSFCQTKHGRNGSAASPDLVVLRGSRMAYASEGDQSARLDAGVVKTLTGNEPITARALYSDPITFPQTWKLWLVSNYDPKADSEDTGIWRRMMKLHFGVIPEANRDPKVKAVLTSDPAARSALLAWAVSGCRDWQARGGGRIGLAPPEKVTAMTDAYRLKQDTLGEWWGDLLAADAELHPQEVAAVGEVRRHYETWCSENGASAVQIKRFTAYLVSKGLESTRGHGGKRLWKGLRINN